ncbi:MAG: glycosyltransferase family 4 protein [Taibaiella sp.]|nr:glycosyltransferase family 4 protein [Taibaiella sp.]
MNIGFDAKRAFHNKTGLGNYSRSLISALDQYYPEHHYYLFAKHSENQAFQRWSAALRQTSIIHPKTHPLDVSWRSLVIPGLLSRYDCQIYHGLSAELPIGPRPKNTRYIVTIHDLIFMRYPKLYSFIDRQIYYRKTLHACKTADHIIAVSEQTKADLINIMKIEDSRISVIYPTVDEIFHKKWSNEALQMVKEKRHLPDRYILNVGTLEERKNALLLLKALPLLDDRVHAVFVGKGTRYQAELDQFIRSYRLQSRVHFLNDIQFAELPAIYQLASALVYPSRFEGFGLPMLEAACSGIPAIGARGSSLEEAGGPGAICIDPDDVEGLVYQIQKVTHDSSYRSLLIRQGYEYAAAISTAYLAKHTMEIYVK